MKRDVANCGRGLTDEFRFVALAECEPKDEMTGQCGVAGLVADPRAVALLFGREKLSRAETNTVPGSMPPISFFLQPNAATNRMNPQQIRRVMVVVVAPRNGSKSE